AKLLRPAISPGLPGQRARSTTAGRRAPRYVGNRKMIDSLASRLAPLAWPLVVTASCTIAQTAPAAEDVTAAAGTTIWVTTTQRPKTKDYERAHRNQSPILVVVMHGASPSEPPTYQYMFAQAAAIAI